MDKKLMKKAGKPRGSSVGAGVPKLLIAIVIVAALLFVFFKPIKNKYNVQVCKHKLSTIRHLQEKYYETAAQFAEHPEDLPEKHYPELLPTCIRVGEETEYFRGTNDSVHWWTMRVTIQGDWENECFVYVNKRDVFVEGKCASRKDIQEANADQAIEEED